MLRFVTLYVVLVLTSGVVIMLALKSDPLAALATASVGCIFKTLAASAHGWAFSKWQRKARQGKPCDCAA